MQGSRYELKRKLAVGGMAEIFLATQRSIAGFERTVVLKRVLPELCADATFVSAFLSEARLVARLNHPNIVQVIDLGEQDGRHFLSMEYIDGFDAATLLRFARAREEPLPPAVVLSIVSDTCLALDYAHNAKDEDGASLQLVHRDVTPSNILVSRDGIAKVLDFGIAKTATKLGEPKTATGVVKGKIAYLAPEQLLGAAIDRRVDVFAVGVTLFELLSNVSPFREDSDFATMRAIVERPAALLETVLEGAPQALTKLCAELLARDRDERLPSCAAAHAALQDIAFSERLGAHHNAVKAFIAAHAEEIAKFQPEAAPATETAAMTAPAARKAEPQQKRRLLVALALVPLISLSVVLAANLRESPKTDTVVSPASLPVSPTPPVEQLEHPAPSAVPPHASPKVVQKAPRPAPSHGTLKILASPWAEVTLDGRTIGTTPLLPIEVSVGEHAVELKHPDHPKFLVTIRVLPGKTAQVSHRFE